MNILVTGAAGFIGSHLSESIQLRGDRVWCLDSLDSSYSTERKRTNLQEAMRHGAAEFVEADICDAGRLTEIFLRVKPDAVIHLAARASVGRVASTVLRREYRWNSQCLGGVADCRGKQGRFCVIEFGLRSQQPGAVL